MKLKFLIYLLLLIIPFVSNAQQASVEKSVSGIQTGFLGIWGHKEFKLSREIALRAELGFDAGIFWGTNEQTGILLAPVINVEPRWYYNLEKRSEKGKKILNNSGNFLTARLGFNPDLFVISNTDENVPAQLAFIPKWGIRRTIGSHFSYEAGFGLGYRYYPGDGGGEASADLHLRIGYVF